MTVGFSATNFLDKALNTLTGTTFTGAAGTFLKLHIGDPGASGANNAAAGSTTRVSITMAAAAGGSKAMNGTNPVWTNGGTSETLSHISMWDASSAGNFELSGALSSTQAWASGNTFTVTGLTIAITPVAA